MLTCLSLACSAKTQGSQPDKEAGEMQMVKLLEDKKLVTNLEEAPEQSLRIESEESKKIDGKIDTYFAARNGQNYYIQLDKPLYKPGETIWIKTWNFNVKTLQGEGLNSGVMYELISPKGAVVLSKRIRQELGKATNDFDIPEHVPGGEYTLRVRSLHDSSSAERSLIVSRYEAPRIKKKLEFVRKAYGEGDHVSATINVKRATGEPLSELNLRPVVILDGQKLKVDEVKTDSLGDALVKFVLPQQIDVGDGLLTILVDDGGITESVSKRIPIILKKVKLSFFPEGGQLVSGVQSRVYFEAMTMLDKPADVEGHIVDDHGMVIEKFKTYHFGLGRLDFTPATGRKYKAVVTKPEGVTEEFSLPLPLEQGCVLRTYDDLEGELTQLRVSVTCTSDKQVRVVAVLRENVLDTAVVDVKADKAATVYLESKDEKLKNAQGVARVTVFDAKNNHPLAERIVYRNRRNTLKIEVEPDQEQYTPRAKVSLKVKTMDQTGAPVSAEIALSVVDDTVISYADDKAGHLLSKTFLEPEIPGDIEEPNFFFDFEEEKSALSLELLMGTRGWRKFEWRPVFSPPPPLRSMKNKGMAFGRGAPGVVMMAPPAAMDQMMEGAAMPEPEALDAPDPQPELKPAPMVAIVNNQPPEFKIEADDDAPLEEEIREANDELALEPPRRDEAKADKYFDVDEDWAQPEDRRARRKKRLAKPKPIAWAPVRVFVAPKYSDEVYTGPRTDFRETLHWEPSLKTDKNGLATVSFYMSDAVTSFRVFSEGYGANLAGRLEYVISSVLPFSMAVKLPQEVSAGDRILVPLTFSNETTKSAKVDLQSKFGDLVEFDAKSVENMISLSAKSRESIYLPLLVTGKMGKSEVAFSATAEGLSDSFEKTLNVVPEGFPIEKSQAGVLKKQWKHTFELKDALQGSVTALIKLEASPVGTLLSGLEGMLREPYGCFEQTSSTNYPNVMVMQYMQTNDMGSSDIMRKSRELIDRGYKRLVGFETKKKGYEWFGQTPAHEALTAYGLLEFVDMQSVYGGVDSAMLSRTVAWLQSRRDGKGGFQRDSQALDSFGRASPEVTDAYITYAISESGLSEDFKTEIARSLELSKTTKDAYLLALYTNTLLNLPAHKAQGMEALKRLLSMQNDGGYWEQAEHSVTRSTGINLHVETTALSILALMKAEDSEKKPDPKWREAADAAIRWMYGVRRGHGSFGSTQATVLALKALTQFATVMSKTQSPGKVIVKLNGQVAAQFDYEAGRKEPMIFENLGQNFIIGKNVVELIHQGDSSLPFTVAVDYRSIEPASDPDTVVDLSTKLEAAEVKMGETVRLNAVVSNKTKQGQPMTIARINFPGGLMYQTWQLKELREKGIISFYETKAREVILYFRSLKPSESINIPIDLVALVPGSYSAAPSSAYLYYSDTKKVWVPGLKINIGQSMK